MTNNPAIDALEPCPCGKEPKLEINGSPLAGYPISYYVDCSDLNCWMGAEKPTKQEAIEEWNRIIKSSAIQSLPTVEGVEMAEAESAFNYIMQYVETYTPAHKGEINKKAKIVKKTLTYAKLQKEIK